VGSIYQDKTFADYWNERAGDKGEPYKCFVLDPVMFKCLGEIKGKVILELGCGNGYLASKFLKKNPAKLILMDISEYNLSYAKKKCQDERISFLCQDATKPWKVSSSSVDIIYSNMMLNEVGNIETPTKEAFRVLEFDGQFIFSVTHPSWDLFVYAQERAGSPSGKIRGLGGYFRRGRALFVMGIDKKVKKYQNKEFLVEHYQRPLSDYFNALIEAGFRVERIIEPELNKRVIQTNPSFLNYQNHPVGLIFLAVKERGKN
jgi:ubiquinone/menaquinone biosynthesis C-methylase UbiE